MGNAELDGRASIPHSEFRIPHWPLPGAFPFPGSLRPPARPRTGGAQGARARLPHRDTQHQLRVSHRLQSRAQRAPHRPHSPARRRPGRGLSLVRGRADQAARRRCGRAGMGGAGRPVRPGARHRPPAGATRGNDRARVVHRVSDIAAARGRAPRLEVRRRGSGDRAAPHREGPGGSRPHPPRHRDHAGRDDRDVRAARPRDDGARRGATPVARDATTRRRGRGPGAVRAVQRAAPWWPRRGRARA